jgi:hypothetical protein
MQVLAEQSNYKAYFKTILLLLVFELISSAFVPALGFHHLRFSIDQLFIIYFSIRITSDYTPFYILVVQLIHSFFTVRGWEIGTIAGVLISLVINFSKDVVQINSKWSIMVVFFFGQSIWNILVGFFLLLKTGNGHFFQEIALKSLHEGLILSFFSPIFFSLMDKIWGIKKEN